MTSNCGLRHCVSSSMFCTIGRLVHLVVKVLNTNVINCDSQPTALRIVDGVQ